MGERYLKSIRLLAQCMQGFERYSGDSVRQHDLTPAQFDLIATLGNTAGMSCKDLGEKTLITKGTLTGVIDRLEQKGLVERERNTDDKRSYLVQLTPAGEQVFSEVFPQIIARGKQLFIHFSDADFTALEATLSGLKRTILGQKTRVERTPSHESKGKMLKTTLLEGKLPAKFDQNIIGNLLLNPDTEEQVLQEKLIIGIRNEAGEIYRLIGATRPNSFTNAIEELVDLGLVDELQDADTPSDGCDAIFSAA
jgi:MarR family 2-MHQ and catechol resistance regulon transcriptional repressor